jgi:20S proteasome subunit alpha 2
MGDMNFSLTTFNKTGKLMQIEYALARVAQGKMALGIKATNGVVIAADKKVSSVLVDAEDYQKIQSITPSTGTMNIISFGVLLDEFAYIFQ